MMGGGQAVTARHRSTQGVVAGLPRRTLGAGIVCAIDVHAYRRKRKLQAGADRGAMRSPGVGGSLQTMMDVDRAHTIASLCREQMQQHGGIEAAAEGDENLCVRRQGRQLQITRVGVCTHQIGGRGR